MRAAVLALILGLLAGAAAVSAQPPEEPPAEPETGSEVEESPQDVLEPPSEQDVEEIEAILRGEEALFGGGDGYVYDPAGRRDPFKSLLEATDAPEIRGPRPEGVPGLLIDEVRLIGILHTGTGYIAQVQAADKQKSYLLREGDQLYDGEVIDIEDGEVVFRQVVQDPTALKPFRERIKTLNP